MLNIRKHFKDKDRGLTVIELIITIAVTAAVASIVAPVFHDLVVAEQGKADTRSAAEAVAFTNQWTASGYTVQDGTGTYTGTLVAIDPATGQIFAHIRGNTSGTGSSVPAANTITLTKGDTVYTLTLGTYTVDGQTFNLTGATDLGPLYQGANMNGIQLNFSGDTPSTANNQWYYQVKKPATGWSANNGLVQSGSDLWSNQGLFNSAGMYQVSAGDTGEMWLAKWNAAGSQRIGQVQIGTWVVNAATPPAPPIGGGK
jgi:prepilin-type N-terminal cleavage/methylation domain-containing protein